MKVTYHFVLAGAYKGKDIGQRSLLIHASVEEHNALCDKVREGYLCDVEEEGPPTCPVCLRKLAAMHKKGLI